ncbi:MAG: hypothetical protein ABIC95_05150 [archaeon]
MHQRTRKRTEHHPGRYLFLSAAALSFLPVVSALSLENTTNGMIYLAVLLILVGVIFILRRYILRIKKFTDDPYQKKENEYDDLKDEMEREL